MPPRTIARGHFSPDTAEFLRLLHKHHVHYLLVGGEAVIFHGHSRLTGADALIRNKAAAGRPRDIEDLEFLRRAARESRS